MSEHLKKASVASAPERKANAVCHLHEKVLLVRRGSGFEGILFYHLGAVMASVKREFLFNSNS